MQVGRDGTRDIRLQRTGRPGSAARACPCFPGGRERLTKGTYMRKIAVLAAVVALMLPALSWAQSCPASGSCLVPHPTPGCDNAACCTAVCAIDPFCCSTEWDSSCAIIASAVCDLGEPGECGDPAAGSCFEVHANGACDDDTCCTAVCNADPTCCSQSWDQICVALAEEFCLTTCSITCPNGSQLENESCAQNKNDICFFPITGSAIVFTLCGKTVCGNLVDESGSGGKIDVDMYRVALFDPDGDGLVRLTVSFTSVFNGFLAVTPASCGDLEAITELVVSSGLCLQTTGSVCLPPGTYNLIVAPGSFPQIGSDNPVICNTNDDYRFTTSCSQDCDPPCGPESGSCFEPNDDPGCDDERCCESVCSVDPFCCERVWDDICVEQAFQICVGPPANDECGGAVAVFNGETPFNNYAATTSIPSPPTTCTDGSRAVFAQDIWFSYTPTCSGTATASLCESVDFDSVIAVYAGSCARPEFLACNDNAPGCILGTSEVTFPVECGQTYLLRIGGIDDEIGAGALTLSCTGRDCAGCIGDLDGSGEVDGADLGLLLGAWDTAGPGDIDGSGTVDGGDLGLLLGAWGTCPRRR